MTLKTYSALVVAFALSITAPSFASEGGASTAGTQENGVEKGLYEPKPLDGVVIEAVEDYPNPLGNKLGLGVGLYPFNGYYTGLIFNGLYQHNFSHVFSWEMVNANYAFSFDKGLTTELADRFSVNPKKIDRLKFLISSNVFFTFMNGKLIFLNDFIRYFRGSFGLGVGFVQTSLKNSISGNFGFRFETFLSQSFAWHLDVRDHLTIGGYDHYVTFVMGAGLAF